MREREMCKFGIGETKRSQIRKFFRLWDVFKCNGLPGREVCWCACSVVSDSVTHTGSTVHGTFQARILERVAIFSSWDLPDPGIKPGYLASPALAGRFFTTSATWEAWKGRKDSNNANKFVCDEGHFDC